MGYSQDAQPSGTALGPPERMCIVQQHSSAGAYLDFQLHAYHSHVLLQDPCYFAKVMICAVVSVLTSLSVLPCVATVVSLAAGMKYPEGPSGAQASPQRLLWTPLVSMTMQRWRGVAPATTQGGQMGADVLSGSSAIPNLPPSVTGATSGVTLAYVLDTLSVSYTCNQASGSCHARYLDMSEFTAVHFCHGGRRVSVWYGKP